MAKRELCLYLIISILCVLLLSVWAFAQCESCDDIKTGNFSAWRNPVDAKSRPQWTAVIETAAVTTTGSQLEAGNKSRDCDDGNPCTRDYKGETSCIHDPVSCDDGNVGTSDLCTNSGCVHVQVGGQGTEGSGNETAMPSAQSSPPASSPVPDGANGTQEVEAANNANRETAKAEVAQPDVCDDGNPCTDDTISGSECINVPRDCSDGNGSTYDYCMDGSCINASLNKVLSSRVPATKSNVSLQNGSLANVSVLANGTALKYGNGVDDGNISSENNTTDVYFRHRPCDDGDPCTNDTFDDGKCIHTPKSCDDANASTYDYCYSGECYNILTNCDKGDPCTDYTYNGSACISIPRSCDDGDPCTIDGCKNGNCTHETKNCDDGDPCTYDSCINGHCVNKWRCDDGNPCTIDRCDSKRGCIHTPVVCSDGKICVEGTCRYPYYYGYYPPYGPAAATVPANSYVIAAGTAITLPWGRSVTALSDLTVENAVAYYGSSPIRYVRQMGQEGSPSQNKTISEQAEMVGLSWNDGAFSLTLIQPNSAILSPQGTTSMWLIL